MNKRWIDKDGNFWDGTSIVLDGMRVFNPSDEQLVAAGYTEYVEPEPTPEEELERARQEKLSELGAYDASGAVNGFDVTIGGNTMSLWIDRETRADYRSSIEAAELLGRTEVKPVFGGQEVTLDITTAKMALAQVQLYANQCYGVTERHKAAIEDLLTVQDVEDYDFTAGYPTRLSFSV